MRYRMTIEDTSHHQPLTHTHTEYIHSFFPLPSAVLNPNSMATVAESPMDHQMILKKKS